MYRISELAEKVGLSRSTLLYYEKLGLLQGVRQTNGYRLYSDKDVQQLHLLLQLQAGGLTLKECKSFLDSKVQRSVLEKRLQQLDEEIVQKQQARTLLAALLGEGSLRLWHQQTDKLAPEAHLDWLKQQGFNEQQALHLKWLSKDMNEHEQYMADFMTVFEHLERWGPSCDADSLKALFTLPTTPSKIIDIGCGKGFSTRLLAKHTHANIVAVDNEQSALDELGERLTEQGLDTRVTLCCASMTNLPFAPESFDCIWSEGSAYIMGIEKALAQWRKLLTDSGVMVVSDLVWLTNDPNPEAIAFWAGEYPDMQTIEKRLTQIRQAGFDVIDHFTMSEQAWHDYYRPLKARVADVKVSMPNSTAIADLEQEIAIYERDLGEFGYQMFVLRKGA
ncbi:MerR family transcriptional regulator [Vibrio vulnificus]|uniref:MerR family transcriptional regulator n=1 Tax=Vibrio vulnificus TaxID=672 RepID=UPI001E2DD366|nr:MerR family transcriptional regulator [Vibrio vulnificus]MCD1408165.1 MerR family transcriptional regulator [Vibrio vulnificus]MCD1417241.1 MerR family transcriptional regulator [Vibrio vulnificus]MCD1424227.1 MerR family transcriptional regulator [Vibrio vulnificus]MCD1439248.1 MerR family transcriptional regulator [Vibrio vulnificus]MCD1441256.1 MerR family transcriptional regulator [Vibrio vulnificus]